MPNFSHFWMVILTIFQKKLTLVYKIYWGCIPTKEHEMLSWLNNSKINFKIYKQIYLLFYIFKFLFYFLSCYTDLQFKCSNRGILGLCNCSPLWCEDQLRNGRSGCYSFFQQLYFHVPSICTEFSSLGSARRQVLSSLGFYL